MIFQALTNIFIFSNIKIKLNSRPWMTELLRGDFTGHEISAASLAFATSLASTTSTVLFHHRTWWLDHPLNQNNQLKAVEACFLKTGWYILLNMGAEVWNLNRSICQSPFTLIHVNVRHPIDWLAQSYTDLTWTSWQIFQNWSFYWR